MSTLIHFEVSGTDEEDIVRLAGVHQSSPADVAHRMVMTGLREARRDGAVLRVGAYRCPVCAVHDPNHYIRCNRPDCTDGRDPR